MRELLVFIEINGEQTYVGSIQGDHPDKASFSYTLEYKENPQNRPIFICNIDDISRASFKKEAENIGLGTGIAMRRFDYLAEGFEKALKKAGDMLAEQGFGNVKRIEKQILETGGIAMLC